MVWNDFWMVTQNSNSEPSDPQLMLANMRDTVRHYRNHPSIVLWCGRNEGVPQPTINEGIIDLLQREDGTRYYSPSSNRINLRPSGPYQWKNPGDYYSTLDRGFAVELGTSSFPTLEAFEAMTAPEDRWPVSDVWAYHDWHQARGGDTHILMQKIAAQLGEPDSLESFERRAQMFNYVDYQAIFEGFYQHLWSPNSGRMLWMTHSSWPSTYWQIYSSDYDTHASYFATKNANAPLHPQMDLSNGKLAVVNTTLHQESALHLRALVFDLENHVLDEEQFPLTAEPNSVTSLAQLPLQKLYEKSSLLLIRLSLLNAENKEVASNFYWVAKDDASYRALSTLPPAQVVVTTSLTSAKGEQNMQIHLHNTGSTPALEVKLNLQHADGTRILPAYWSDNYVSLLPGEDRDVTVSFPAMQTLPKLSMRGWNLPSQAIAQ
jgi:beta-galactosidase/beta-glucuronidase